MGCNVLILAYKELGVRKMNIVMLFPGYPEKVHQFPHRRECNDFSLCHWLSSPLVAV